MKQSKLESHIESTANIASGFMISWAVWVFVVGPLIAAGYLTLSSAFTITCIFTVTSYLRSYFWRRFFANNLHRWLHEKISRNDKKDENYPDW